MTDAERQSPSATMSIPARHLLEAEKVLGVLGTHCYNSIVAAVL